MRIRILTNGGPEIVTLPRLALADLHGYEARCYAAFETAELTGNLEAQYELDHLLEAIRVLLTDDRPRPAGEPELPARWFGEA